MTVKLGDRESKLETELVRRVRASGGRAEKLQAVGRRGWFDRLVTLPGGRVIFVEMKRPRGGRLSAHQILRASTYRRLGAEVALISLPEQIDELLRDYLVK